MVPEESFWAGGVVQKQLLTMEFREPWIHFTTWRTFKSGFDLTDLDVHYLHSAALRVDVMLFDETNQAPTPYASLNNCPICQNSDKFDMDWLIFQNPDWLILNSSSKIEFLCLSF